MDKYDANSIENRILKSLKKETDFSSSKREEISFHMTDWMKEFKQLEGLYHSPEKFNTNETFKVLLSFLIHAPEHINEAARLLTGIEVEGIFKK